MAEAKVQSLIVRPLRSADLSFPIAGIIAERSDLAYLGIDVSESRFKDIKGKKDKIYNAIHDADEDTGKLILDSLKITEELTLGSLFVLRNEVASSSLDQMIYQRQNAFLERYKHNEKRILEIRKSFPTSDADPTGINVVGSKLGRMQSEFTALNNRFTALNKEYIENTNDDKGDKIDRNIVVKKQMTQTETQPVGIITPKHVTKVEGTGISQSLTAGSADTPQKEGVRSKQYNPKNEMEYDDFYTSQKVTNFYSEFSHPYLDNIIRHERAQLELMTEMLNDSLYAFRVNHIIQIWENELQALDREVEKFQTSFIHTFLLPPFPGVITTVYKDVGENVQAGEPVIRIEDNSTILLVGIINYRGVLRLGDTVKIRTGDLFEDGQVLDIPDAKVVSIRGHDSDNDFWDLIFQCDNPKDATGRYRLPINYHFDRDNIEMTF